MPPESRESFAGTRLPRKTREIGLSPRGFLPHGRQRLAAGLLVATLLAGSSARGDTSANVPPEVTALLREGARFMEQRRYEKALQVFQEAYRLVPNGKILFNLGVAYASLGRNADALTAFEGFLEQVPDASPAGVANARRHIGELRPKVGMLVIESDRSSGNVDIDGRDLGTVSLNGHLFVEPGRHQVRARAGDQTVERSLEVGAHGTMTLMLTFGSPHSPKAGVMAHSSGPPMVAAPGSTRPRAVEAPPLTLTAYNLDGRPASVAPPLHRRPWFWVAAGGAIVVAAALAAVLLRPTEYPAIDQAVDGP